MMLWLALAIIQPFLIRQKKFRTHKLVGKISYGIMPLVFITAYLVIRHTYYSNLTRYSADVTSGTTAISPEEILIKAAASVDIGLIYFTWLFTFYTLAIIYRKTIIFHATYMFAAILTVLGPTADRLINNVLSYFHITYTFFAQNVVLFFILFVLLALVVYQKRNGHPIKASVVALCLYGAGTITLLYLTLTPTWRTFVELILWT